MKKITYENNFIYLCISLIALLFSAALIHEFPGTWGEEFFSIVTILMFIVSIKSLNTEMKWKKLVYILIALLVLITVLSKIFVLKYIVYLNLFILLFFFIGSFESAYKQILFVGKKIDRNKIIGSLSLYILLGLIWTVVYLLLLVMDPNAFSGIEPGTWHQTFSRAAYYSFVTLTTLGYGDILPTKPIAEFFVYMEAIIGVFYMAIIVSSLVSVALSNYVKKDN
ncbi:potassium channel family protein [Sulfurovum sp.]|uniref:potassium channel family protein n=1 Tax=Sulfurovum sp. TaxID=1969726 RepID=UPI003564E783